jgi:hypothetical protein
MAMKDIKSITVAPDEEEVSVKRFQSFGWELKSTQEVKTQDVQTFTGQDSDGTEHYQTKRGEHYIKLTFERDPARQNYAEIKSLEEQYYKVKIPVYPEKPQVFGFLWIILIVIGLIAWAIPGIVIIVLRIIFYKKKKQAWEIAFASYEKDNSAAETKRTELLNKAQALV